MSTTTKPVTKSEPKTTKPKDPNKVDWKKLEIGAMWRRESASGSKYLSGQLKLGSDVLEKPTVINFKVFPNTYKEEGSNEPDFRLYMNPESLQKKEKKEVVKDEILDGPENLDTTASHVEELATDGDL